MYAVIKKHIQMYIVIYHAFAYPSVYLYICLYAHVYVCICRHGGSLVAGHASSRALSGWN